MFIFLGFIQEFEIKFIYDFVFELDVVYFDNKVMFIQFIEVVNFNGFKIIIEIYYLVCDEEKCFLLDIKIFEVDLVLGKVEIVEGEIIEEDLEKLVKLIIDVKGIEKFELVEEEEKGMFIIFFLGFLGGFIVLLMFCVFFMILLMVFFFIKSVKNK